MLPKLRCGRNLERGEESKKYARGAQENLWPKLFSGAPRCAPLRLRLLEHMPCLWQVIENTMVYTWLLCRICSGASKIYVCQYNAKYRPDACEIHGRGHFLEIFGVLIKFFFPFAPCSPHIRGEEMANANVSGERSASQGNNR